MHFVDILIYYLITDDTDLRKSIYYYEGRKFQSDRNYSWNSQVPKIFFDGRIAVSKEKAGSCPRILMAVIPKAHLASNAESGAWSRDTSWNLEEEMKVNTLQ